MSKLQELINKLCPNGVEYKELGDLVDINTGKLNANKKIETGKYLFFTCDEYPTRIDTYAFDGEAIMISGNGSKVGHINYYVGKFNAYQRTYVLMSKNKELNLKYLMYYLKNCIKKYINSKSLKASVPYITLPMLSEFKIPVPPIEVQDEIVRILDNFTNLQAELQAELVRRIKQYEHIRNVLLNSNKLEYISVCLEEILKIKNGKDYKHLNSGEYPIYGSGGIIGYVDEYVYDKPSVLIPRKGSIDKLYYVDKPFWNVDTIFYTEINEEKAIAKYVYYCLENIGLEKLNTGAGVPSLTQSVLNKVKINLPPIHIQEKIVYVLDNFEKVCKDLNIGLPAEIKERQKQYEFYRNLLLTFPNGIETILKKERKKERDN